MCSVQGRRYQHSNAVTPSKVYELRTYAIWPHHVKNFLNLTSEEFHLRTSQSKLIGYWTSELGGLNEVVHIWEYGTVRACYQRLIELTWNSHLCITDSLEHRAQVRAQLAVNSEWIQRYFAKILPWMSGQQNSIVSVIPDIPFSNSLDKGVYQLQTLSLTGNPKKQLVELAKSNEKSGDLLIGAFQTLHGNLNTAILLWKHPTLTAATNLVSKQLNSNLRIFQISNINY